MKRLEIIVEGQTEREFISNVLAPYLQKILGEKNIYIDVRPITVNTNSNSRGGMTKYSHLRRDIKKSLGSKDPGMVVSMMIDFFRKPADLPTASDSASSLSTHIQEAELIETGIANDISDTRFIPYIQLHEFEAFLFAAKSGFQYCYGNDKRCEKLYKIIEDYDNPEDINSSPDGAPSKRMLAIIPEYNKVMDGNIIIMQNGIDAILNRCHRFKKWINQILSKLLE